MKAVILAGGCGSRLSEETHLRPKPMVRIGAYPILWHIMKLYSTHGINDFIVCLGYKGYYIKEYFSNYLLHTSDVTINLRTNTTEIHQLDAEPWRVTLVDTGEDVMTGGRIKRIREHLEESDFCLTYGDGVADIDIRKLIQKHKEYGTLATITGVSPPGRFGVLEIEGNKVKRFEEKPPGGSGCINGGFFVLSNSVIDYIEDDSTVWEKEPLHRLAEEGQLSVYEHKGFWQPMDTLRDHTQLEHLWASGKAPWKIW